MWQEIKHLQPFENKITQQLLCDWHVQPSIQAPMTRMNCHSTNFQEFQTVPKLLWQPYHHIHLQRRSHHSSTHAIVRCTQCGQSCHNKHHEVYSKHLVHLLVVPLSCHTTAHHNHCPQHSSILVGFD